MKARDPTRVSADDGGGSSLLLWTVAILLLLTAVFPYFLGVTLIKIEVLAGQPFLRLILTLFVYALVVSAIMLHKPLVALPALLVVLVIFGQT